MGAYDVPCVHHGVGFVQAGSDDKTLGNHQVKAGVFLLFLFKCIQI